MKKEPNATVQKDFQQAALSDASDDEIAILCSSTPEAFSFLYQRYIGPIYRYVYSRVGNQQDAEDITSSVFLAAFNQIPRYQSQNKFPAWIFTIARNRIADHYRSLNPTLPLDEPREDNKSLDPEAIVERRLSLERVSQALVALSEDRANAIALCIFGGLSPSEIGEFLGKSEDAVKMLISRGIRDLSDRLGPTMESGDAK